MPTAHRTHDHDPVRIRRAYEEPGGDEGYRVLVDRLWPRGIRKESLEIDAWLKELAPSDELRRWFGHDPERWEEFARRYREELARGAPHEALLALLEQARSGPVTLLYGAKDTEHNQAVVLQGELRRAIDEQPKPRSHAAARHRRDAS